MNFDPGQSAGVSRFWNHKSAIEDYTIENPDRPPFAEV
jgi:hypothetical protein